jgi:hypothetical protein
MDPKAKQIETMIATRIGPTRIGTRIETEMGKDEDRDKD